MNNLKDSVKFVRIIIEGVGGGGGGGVGFMLQLEATNRLNTLAQPIQDFLQA